MCDPSFLAAGVASATIVKPIAPILTLVILRVCTAITTRNFQPQELGYFERECCATMFLNYLASGATG